MHTHPLLLTVVKFAFWASLIIGATASLTGNLNNARDIGAAFGDVGGAGSSGLLVAVQHWGDQMQQGALDNGTQNLVPKN